MFHRASKTSFSFVHTTSDKSGASHPIPEEGKSPLVTVKVQIIGCTNLPAADSNGKSDPYVKLELGGIKVKTSVIKKQLNPLWPPKDATFEFPIYKSTIQTRGALLYLTVWDKNMIGKEHLGELCLQPTEWFRRKGDNDVATVLSFDDHSNNPLTYPLTKVKTRTRPRASDPKPDSPASIQIKIGVILPHYVIKNGSSPDLNVLFQTILSEESTGGTHNVIAKPHTHGLGSIRSFTHRLTRKGSASSSSASDGGGMTFESRAEIQREKEEEKGEEVAVETILLEPVAEQGPYPEPEDPSSSSVHLVEPHHDDNGSQSQSHPQPHSSTFGHSRESLYDLEHRLTEIFLQHPRMFFRSERDREDQHPAIPVDAIPDVLKTFLESYGGRAILGSEGEVKLNKLLDEIGDITDIGPEYLVKIITRATGVEEEGEGEKGMHPYATSPGDVGIGVGGTGDVPEDSHSSEPLMAKPDVGSGASAESTTDHREDTEKETFAPAESAESIVTARSGGTPLGSISVETPIPPSLPLSPKGSFGSLRQKSQDSTPSASDPGLTEVNSEPTSPEYEGGGTQPSSMTSLAYTEPQGDEGRHVHHENTETERSSRYSVSPVASGDKVDELEKVRQDTMKRLVELQQKLEEKMSEYQLEMEELHNRKEELEAELGASKRDEKELRLKDHQTSKQLTTLESEVTRIQGAFESAQGNYQTLHKKYQEQYNEAETYRETIRRSELEMKDLEGHLGLSVADAERWKASAAAAQQIIDSINTELDAARNAVQALDTLKQEILSLKETEEGDALEEKDVLEEGDAPEEGHALEESDALKEEVSLEDKDARGNGDVLAEGDALEKWAAPEEGDVPEEGDAPEKGHALEESDALKEVVSLEDGDARGDGDVLEEADAPEEGDTPEKGHALEESDALMEEVSLEDGDVLEEADAPEKGAAPEEGDVPEEGDTPEKGHALEESDALMEEVSLEDRDVLEEADAPEKGAAPEEGDVPEEGAGREKGHALEEGDVRREGDARKEKGATESRRHARGKNDVRRRKARRERRDTRWKRSK